MLLVFVLLLRGLDALYSFIHAVDGCLLDALHRAALIQDDEVENPCLHVFKCI